jgi:tRNA pseudouridine55 synthase
VVAGVRRELPRGTKVGHAGTLDPFATGLLLVLIGRATRAQRFLMGLPKTYRAVARLGWVSETGDRDGTLTETGRMPERLELPVGEMLQFPHAYSAVKVGGERAYSIARRGETPATKPRTVNVHRAELLWREDERAAFEIECSAGTYVRSLIEGLGDAYCEELERTAIGPFALEDAGRELPLADALTFMPERALSEAEEQAVRNGRPVPRGDAVEGEVRLTAGGRLVAIGAPRADELRPVVVFDPA